MGNGTDLLRLLEPTVRPAGLPGPAVRQGTPIEARPFESVLEEAQALAANQPGPDGEQVGESGQGAAPNPLGALGQIDRIENPSLRRIIGGAGTA